MEHKNKLRQKFDDQKAPIDKDALWGKISADNAFPISKNRNIFRNLSLCIVGLALFSLGLSFYLSIEIHNESSAFKSLANKNELVKIDNSNNNNNNNNNRGLLNDEIESLIQYKNEEYAQTQKNISENRISATSSDQTSKNDSIDNSISLDYSSKSTTEMSNISSKTSTQSNNSKSINQEQNISQNPKSIESNINESVSISRIENDILNNSLIDITQLKRSLNLLDSPSPKVLLSPIATPILQIHKTRKWSLDFSIGRGKLYHKIEQKSIDSEYFTLWDDNTINLESYAFNIALSRHLTNGWSVKLDNSLETSFRKFEFTSAIEQSILDDTEKGLGYFLLLEKQNRYIQHHKYNIINTSLILEKNISIDGLSIILGAGLYSNFSISSSGNIYTASNEAIDINQLSDYNSSFQFSPLYSIELRYPITNRFDLFTNVRYKSRIQNSAAISEIQHSTNGVFANFGLGVHF